MLLDTRSICGQRHVSRRIDQTVIHTNHDECIFCFPFEGSCLCPLLDLGLKAPHLGEGGNTRGIRSGARLCLRSLYWFPASCFIFSKVFSCFIFFASMPSVHGTCAGKLVPETYRISVTLLDQAGAITAARLWILKIAVAPRSGAFIRKMFSVRGLASNGPPHLIGKYQSRWDSFKTKRN